ncbi:radical SAM protein [Candidatus Woesearchaeota archaeon]|nr:radical SAM protein [Candidatus Woesearchaeota archaeon]
MKIDLVQPRHNYASKKGVGHIYMPTSLLTVGARLLNAGVDVTFHDENTKPLEVSSDYVGFNLLGAPYIPEVIKLQERIRQEQGEKTFLVGGQVVSGLNSSQLERLFGSSTHNGNDDSTLTKVLGIDEKALVSPEKTSLIPAYERLSDDAMREYLSREFSLYVSQGCRWFCNFCAAVRTWKYPQTGKVIQRVKESYRDASIIKADLSYLVGKAKYFGLDELQLYMSNLDVFQTPQQLLKFAYAVQEVKQSNQDFKISIRGLATVDSFLRTRENMPKSIEELVNAGFNTVGFGVDGWTKEVWAAVEKGQNTEEKCLEAIRSTREDFGMTPEILMVFGHPTADTEESLDAAYQVTRMVVGTYGAVPRPHVSKDFIPGNNGWKSPEHLGAVESLLEHPEAFQSLDFTALPSPLTHPNGRIRELATKYFLKMCELPGNTTQHVKPITPNLTSEELEEVKRFNESRFDR